MAFTIRPVAYYYANVRDELGAASGVLSLLAERGVNLLAFTAVPTGPTLAQFSLFPEDPNKLVAEASAVGLSLDGPHHALLVQGDDELGALNLGQDAIRDPLIGGCLKDPEWHVGARADCLVGCVSELGVELIREPASDKTASGFTTGARF